MFKDKIKKQDIGSIFKFAICWPVALFYKLFHQDVWLISERPKEARDNGYWLFKYICETKTHKDTYYIISKGLDADKVKTLGKIIPFGGWRHHFLYLVAKKHISTQIDGGMPNIRVCNFLERKKLLKNKKCFLQHGITKDVISFGFYKDTRVNLFVCAAKPETEFVKATFGYPEGAVQELGFARFDNLQDTSTGNKQILIMPTWRAWLSKGHSKSLQEAKEKFKNSLYYQKWSSVLQSERLWKLLEENNYTVLFYPHSDMQPFVDIFQSTNERIVIARDKNYDVQDLLKCSNILVTDYSSVAFDFAYMEKPLLYYHFDYEKYRMGQHPEGYFSYQNHGFGAVVEDEHSLVDELEKIIQQGKCADTYKLRIEEFFDIRDNNNSERICQAIENL